MLVCLHVCVVRLSPILRVVSPPSTSRLTMATSTWPRCCLTEELLWTSWRGWVYSALCCLGGVLPAYRRNRREGGDRAEHRDPVQMWNRGLVSMTHYWAVPQSSEVYQPVASHCREIEASPPNTGGDLEKMLLKRAVVLLYFLWPKSVEGWGRLFWIKFEFWTF